MHSLPLLLSFVSLAAAHFHFLSPPSRANDETTQGQFPCGGSAALASRSSFPLAGGTLQLKMGHDHSQVQVLLALGNDGATTAFNYVLRPTFTEQGIGMFCVAGLDLAAVPGLANVTAGTNATIQVVTSSESAGGLYNCADVTFTSSAVAGLQCTNGTGVGTVPYTGSALNANGTGSAAGTGTASASAGASASASGSSGSSGAVGGPSATPTASATSTSAAAAATRSSVGTWGMVVGGALGVAALL